MVTRRAVWLEILSLGVLFSLGLGFASPALGEEFFPLPGVVHVHTTFSTGEDLEELVSKARIQGLRVIVLTDNYLLRWEYGLFPLRYLVRKVVTMPSVKQFGIKKFLQAIREVQEENPDLILIPGVETIPFYYWEGSLLRGNLKMFDGQKNILVVGMEREEDYTGMPVIGNGAFYRYTRQSVLQLWPLLLLAVGFWLARKTRTREIRLRYFRIQQKVSYGLYGWPLVALSLLFLADRFPFTIPLFDSYRGSADLAPYQQLIDYVRERGGMSFWSMPEAKDFHRYTFGRLRTVTIKTDPYPEMLAKTKEYTGFGAIYQDNITFTRPGGGWDEILLAYCRGERESPPWGIGEIAFHQSGQAGKELYQVQTVFFAREITPKAVLEAMRTGRMYALLRSKEEALILENFTITDPASKKKVFMGKRLRLQGSPVVNLSLKAETRGNVQFSLSLIRSGEVIETFSGTTPQTFTYRDHSFPDGRGYYRVEVRGPTWIVSNPIFVERHTP